MQRKYFYGYHYHIYATWVVDKVASLRLSSEVTIVIIEGCYQGYAGPLVEAEDPKFTP